MTSSPLIRTPLTADLLRGAPELEQTEAGARPHSELVEFRWGAYDIVQHQRYYRAQVADKTVSFANLEEVEVAATLGYRWWPLAELLATTEDVIDNQLAVITAALSGGH